ncbi:Alpha/Beta hydrolase protein, partial [Mycena amicta]
YLAYEILTALLRVPYWILISLPPMPASSALVEFSKSNSTDALNFTRNSYGFLKGRSSCAKLPNHLALLSGVGYHGVWVEPAEEDLIVGKLRTWISAAGISTRRIPGYWLHKPHSNINLEAPLMPGEKIVYALHGGAYTRLSAHPSDVTGGIVRGLLEKVDSVHRTFSIEYRLSSTAPFPRENPFPTALVDVLAGYSYLIGKFPASEIIIEGDSAGGNLALALTRYLVEYPNPKLPPPGGLLLLSPWCDLGGSHTTPDSSFHTCRGSDYLPVESKGSLLYPVLAFVGPFGLGAAEVNPYISPASKHLGSISFAGFPSTFISAGGAEVLRDSIRTLYQRMARDSDQVQYLEAADAVHDFVVFEKTAHEPERNESLRAMADWVATLG